MRMRGMLPAGFQPRLILVLLAVSILPLAIGAAAFFSLVNANIARETFEKIAFARDAKKSELTQYVAFAGRQAESLAQTNIARYSIGDFYGFSYGMNQIASNEAEAGERLRQLFGAGGGEKTAKQLGLTFLGRIPIDPNVVLCGDTGTCYRDAHTDSTVSRAFDDIAAKMGRLIEPS